LTSVDHHKTEYFIFANEIQDYTAVELKLKILILTWKYNLDLRYQKETKFSEKNSVGRQHIRILSPDSFL
jgi:hypothetical protein